MIIGLRFLIELLNPYNCFQFSLSNYSIPKQDFYFVKVSNTWLYVLYQYVFVNFSHIF